MSRLIRVTDLEDGGIRHILEADNAATFCKDVNMALGEADTLHIDVDSLTREEIRAAMEQIPPEEQTRISIVISPEHLSEALLDSLGADDIAVADGRFIIGAGAGSPGVKERFRVLSHNLRLKSKTYEMEIIESLLSDADAESRKYQELKSRYDNLKAASGFKQDEDLASRYINVMDKYKQALDRLDRLRKSKLGRLQMAYWNRKGRH
ncbi:hypothetical protein WN59_10335 [Salinicoccus sediminis]|uniref:Uncharacterized protein n=1 Tax=Salinicoccus sediminis TaxID=1432562 RepID=A0A0M2SM97_9STAP|nr:hypothetical protein [Salinicoccus sediminis]KKK33987.1 hypothetical protein WN59_10335 [Salinicoccus sediminis]